MRALSVLLFIAVIIGVAFIIPVPRAAACDHACGLDTCVRGGHPGQEGWWKLVFFNDSEVLMGQQICYGSGHTLYNDCIETPCVAFKSNGRLFHLDNNLIFAFSIKNKAEGQRIIARIGKEGLNAVASAYNPERIETANFTAYYAKLHTAPEVCSGK